MSDTNHYTLFGEPSIQNIEENQHGRLTHEQQSALERAVKGQRSSFVFWGVITLTMVGFLIFFFWQVAGTDGLLSPTSFITIGLVLLGVVFLILVVSGFPIIISQDEIERGQVESVIGKVVWTGRRYTFVSDSRKLKLLQQGRVVPPGDYRFCCLPESGLVVIAQKLGAVSSRQANDLFLEALARANHFSMDDLQANRDGALSGVQEVRLLGYSSLLGISLLIFLGISYMVYQSQTSADKLLVNVFLGTIALIMLLRLGMGSVKVMMDVWSGKVESRNGQVTRHIRRGRNARYYFYQLGNIKFIVSKSAYNALIEGRKYRVYFAPRSKRIVAIEPI